MAIEDLATMKKSMESWDREKWLKSINEELKSISDYGAWIKTALPPGKAAIPCKMVSKREFDDNIIVCHFKAHMVAMLF